MKTTKQAHIYQLSHTKSHQHQDTEEISKYVVETGTKMAIGRWRK